MNVITLASRKGAGKSTLAAHLSAAAAASGRRCLLIDTDPQGPLALWHARRPHGAPAIKATARGIDGVLARAMAEGYEWAFIDTPPTQWMVVTEAIRAATLVVIPARPSMFDVAAVHETEKTTRERHRPYAVVINAAPAKRDDKESPVVAAARRRLAELNIPVWSGQITQRAGLAISLATGTSAPEKAPRSAAAEEIAALWTAVRRSVAAVNAVNAAEEIEEATAVRAA